MRVCLIAVFCLGSIGLQPARAAVPLFDFESHEETSVWHDERAATLGKDKRLEQAQRFAASGNCALRFQTPAWRPEEHGGQQRWPAFEGRPPLTDWSKFDRLVMEVVNTTPSEQKLALLVTDSKKPTRQGAQHSERLPPESHTRFIVPIREQFAQKKVDARDIQVMHFYTEDPPVDLTVFIDRMLLLEPGQEVPPLPAEYLKQLVMLQAPAIEAVRKAIDAAGERVQASAAGAPEVARWASTAVAQFREELSRYQASQDQQERFVLDMPRQLARIRGESAALESLTALRVEFEKIRPTVQATPSAADDIAVGFVSSMEKVLPRAGSPSFQVRSRMELALARNEKEGFQTIVVPFGRSLKRVQVQVGDLRARDGTVLSGDHIAVAPVGYVETKAEPPYGSPHVGWWPDPILGFLTDVDVAEGDAQAFWVRVHAPKSQAAGVYQGQLKVVADGTPLLVFDLAVRVYGFEVPDASPLPLAITFAPHDHPTAQTQEKQAAWRQSEDYPINAWKKHKDQWADFLADYYLTYDSLYGYRNWEPDFAILKRLDDEGRLGRFNLGYYDKFSEKPAAAAEWMAFLRPRYRKAKELGLLDHAYIYGCDENPADVFPQVERTAAMIKAEFPDVPVMTTTYDHSYGLDSGITSVDAWCPLTPRFDPAKAAKARARGKEVWWYICCGPRHPHANMFVEYPAIEGRLLMGAMTAKYRPDGFLYYQISIWNAERPIESGPFTTWDPRSWTTYHGDGSWTCAGPGGTPLATIRLENFRDGLEDYAYFRTLEATVAKVEASAELRAKRSDWLTRARSLLAVPEDVVESLTVYTRDPDAVYRYRAALAEAIEAAGVDAVCP